MSGIIDISKLNIPPEKHELDTARYFSELGYDIIFIRPSNINEQHTPDIYMNGHEWEMKCPQGNGRNTIERIIKKAVLQSPYIIIDLRRIKVSEETCISQIKKQFELRKRIKTIHIIKKTNELMTISRK